MRESGGKWNTANVIAALALADAVAALWYSYRSTNIAQRGEDRDRTVDARHEEYVAGIVRKVTGKSYCTDFGDSVYRETFQSSGRGLSFAVDARSKRTPEHIHWSSDVENLRYDERNNGVRFDVAGHDEQAFYLTQPDGDSVFFYYCSGPENNARCSGTEAIDCSKWRVIP